MGSKIAAGFRVAGPFLLLALAGCEKLAVDTVAAARARVESTVTSVEAGVVEPFRKASVAASVAGRIAAVNCEVHDRVEAETVLIELENDVQRLRVEETAREAERLRRLASIEAADLIERAEFAYERAKAEYELTRIKAPFAGVVADVNARVGEATYGATVPAAGGASAASEPLAYLVDDSRLHVEAEVDEADVNRLAIGQTARIKLGGIEERILPGRLSFISPVVSTDEDESRTAEIHVELLAPAGGAAGVAGAGGVRGSAEPVAAGPGADGPPIVRPSFALIGMSADVEIIVERADDVLAIPTSVVLERGEERFVFVVRDGMLVRQRIRTGLGNWELTEVREGLTAGDHVVLPDDVKKLADGVKVEPRESVRRP
ncbi:MAG: HlyD family efflux transporter periplasmic adaptor subunit [Planctomycetes bacterium]|nr:HlyD family efflux transporter periplasmic adaptor subunit [Planctomycetota bacterium]